MVEYFSLEKGDAAVYGLPEHEVILNGYRFFFASAKNKKLFEVREGRAQVTMNSFRPEHDLA